MKVAGCIFLGSKSRATVMVRGVCSMELVNGGNIEKIRC